MNEMARMFRVQWILQCSLTAQTPDSLVLQPLAFLKAVHVVGTLPDDKEDMFATINDSIASADEAF